MGIIDKFIDKRVQAKLAPLVHELAKKHWLSSSYSWAGLGTAIYSALNNDFTNSDTLFSIVDLRARKESSVPFYAYKKKKGEDVKKYLQKSRGLQGGEMFKAIQVERLKALDEVVTDSDLARLLARPSFTMGADSFWYGVYFQYATRECFIRKNRGGIVGGKVVELEILDHRAVEVVPVKQGSREVSHYNYNSNQGVQRVEKADMIHWKSYDPNDPLRGLDPLRPLKRRIEQDLALTDASVYAAKNNGAIGAIMPKQQENFNETQVSQLENTLNNVANNTKKSKAIGFLPAPFDYVNFGRTADELQILEQLGWTQDRICHVLGVDPVIMNWETTYANKEQGQKNWVANRVLPVVNSLRDELNRSLLPEFKEDVVIDSDFSMLSELQDDYTKLVEYLLKLFNIGAVTQNEIRPLVGFEPTKEALHNAYYIQSGYVPLADMQMTDEPMPLKNYGDY
jgi:HK97 family phage portal protein